MLRNVVGLFASLAVSVIVMLFALFMITGHFITQDLGAVFLLVGILLFFSHVILENRENCHTKTNRRDKLPYISHPWV
ncbi:MAG: hypothetical protein QG591_1983 [Planctomycetota bacterium]|nr:hypothetical protein [Planctomycetota bacterium]MDQ1284525.1 hypothetical protein [Patescibacteria group bacterium]